MNQPSTDTLSVPAAPERPFEHQTHGHHRQDPWAWLNDREDADTATYLQAENEYADSYMQPLAGLVDSVEQDLRGRIPEEQFSVPSRRGPFEWWQRTREGWEYAQVWRRPVPEVANPDVPAYEDPAAELMWDENELAKEHEYFSLSARSSRDGRYVAQLLDTTGDERYELRILDTQTKQLLPDHIEDVSPNVVWGPDGTSILYLPLDEVRRPCAVKVHTLGADPADDATIFEDTNRANWLWAAELPAGRFAVIGSGSMSSTEHHVMDFERPELGLLPVLERLDNVRSSIDHHGENIIALTNEGGATNMRLLALPIAALQPGHVPALSEWRELVPHRDDVAIDDMHPFANHIVLVERADGQAALRIIDADPVTSDVQPLAEARTWQPDELVAWSLSLGSNSMYDAEAVRVTVSNPATVPTTYDVDLSTGNRSVVHVQRIGGSFDSNRYAVERIWATAEDGERIPISLLRRADLDVAEPHPMMLVGYGSYGITYDAAFSAYRLALVERGVTVAFAHIRGGGEFGERWWLQGKLDHKLTTFTDFIACAEHLIDAGRTSPKLLAIRGGSAGGMLMGAVANMRPELFRAVVAQVPFVDCVTTVLDPDLPLSEMEWEEWGNPQDEATYHYMLRYSPYDNVTAQNYPSMYVTGGFHDPRVSYWEPAKWVAKLRKVKTNDEPLLLRINMGAGHFGSSGRYGHLHEEAMIYAFVLQRLGLNSD